MRGSASLKTTAARTHFRAGRSHTLIAQAASLNQEIVSIMGHHQTAAHRHGKHSYHQIGLVRGQFGNVPEDAWLDWIAQMGFDGWEEATWELDLKRCGEDAGAKA